MCCWFSDYERNRWSAIVSWKLHIHPGKYSSSRNHSLYTSATSHTVYSICVGSMSKGMRQLASSSVKLTGCPANKVVVSFDLRNVSATLRLSLACYFIGQLLIQKVSEKLASYPRNRLSCYLVGRFTFTIPSYYLYSPHRLPLLFSIFVIFPSIISSIWHALKHSLSHSYTHQHCHHQHRQYVTYWRNIYGSSFPANCTLALGHNHPAECPVLWYIEYSLLYYSSHFIATTIKRRPNTHHHQPSKPLKGCFPYNTHQFCPARTSYHRQ